MSSIARVANGGQCQVGVTMEIEDIEALQCHASIQIKCGDVSYTVYCRRRQCGGRISWQNPDYGCWVHTQAHVIFMTAFFEV